MPHTLTENRLTLAENDTHWRQLNQTGAANYILLSYLNIIEIGDLSPDNNDLGTLINFIQESTYYLDIDRKISPTCSSNGNPRVLSPTCENLAFCLNYLQAMDPSKYELLNNYMNRIFPNIDSTVAIPMSGGGFELKIHIVGNSNRWDLTIPINNVGTGVANALAILYVTLTADASKIFLLEEPDSFLHPRALKELFSILKEEGKDHQYIISTHSSELLRNVTPSTVTLLEFKNQQTKTKQIFSDNYSELQSKLIDLGIRLTDLYGCNHILWVEGETEQSIFPKILEKFFPAKAQSIATLKLFAANDFESKKISANKISYIYKTLSESNFLAPPSLAITLDRENRREEELSKLEKDTNGLVKFLPKPMIEDYLLDPDAVLNCIRETINNPIISSQINIDNVRDCIEKEKLKKENKLGSEFHAAKCIKLAFEKITSDFNSPHEYNKITHGTKIAEYILSKNPDHFNELKQWLTSIIDAIDGTS
jgi:hypothetical protein